jgi:membrane-associated phospholipid phosphatase
MGFAMFALALAWGAMLLLGGTDLDELLLRAFYAGERNDVVALARFMTELGGWAVLVPLTLLGAAWLAWRRRFIDAFLLLFVTLAGRGLVDLQKIYSARIRPEEHEHLVTVQSLSFPSAHAANSTIVYISLVLLLSEHPRTRGLLIWLAVWLALLVGASRVILGVHWPSDVIAGWAFGLFWTLGLLALAGRPLTEGTPAPVRHSPWKGDDHDRSGQSRPAARR